MSRPLHPIQPLPRVASPPVWSWYYFRVRYLPTVASSIAIVATLWLWAMNLPEPTGANESFSASESAEGPANAKRKVVELVITNMAELRAFPTNGNSGVPGGLVERD